MFHYLFILNGNLIWKWLQSTLYWLNNTCKKYFSNLMTLSQMNLASLRWDYSLCVKVGQHSDAKNTLTKSIYCPLTLKFPEAISSPPISNRCRKNQVVNKYPSTKGPAANKGGSCRKKDQYFLTFRHSFSSKSVLSVFQFSRIQCPQKYSILFILHLSTFSVFRIIVIHFSSLKFLNMIFVNLCKPKNTHCICSK